MAPKGLLQHIQLCPQQVNLGPDIHFEGRAGDNGERVQGFATGQVADQEGLDAVAQSFGGNRNC